jgi:hypothetical protein
VTNNTNQIRRTATAAAADRLGRYGIIGGSAATQSSNASTTGVGGHPMQTQVPQAGTSSTSLDDSTTGTLNSLNGRWKVSAKIQQLLNTLKRPKRRPLPEFYEDDDIELELAANPKDPNAPKPEGGPMTPALGDQLIIPSGLPRSLEAAIQRYGSSSYKAAAATVLDPNGKMFTTLTYGITFFFSSPRRATNIKCWGHSSIIHGESSKAGVECVCVCAILKPISQRGNPDDS